MKPQSGDSKSGSEGSGVGGIRDKIIEPRAAFYRPLPLLLAWFLGSAAASLLPLFAPAAAQAAPLRKNAGAKATVFSAPRPLKRKFINSGILRPKIKPPVPQRPEFPEFSTAVFVPKFFDSHERFERVDLSALVRLRFLTAADFFPFNYIDAEGNLAGYNVDLVRAICAELGVENLCRIETRPWEALLPALQAGGADAVIAGLAPTVENRAFLGFSRAYMRFPARFIALKNGRLAQDSQNFTRLGYDFSEFLLLRGAALKVGAIKNTAHENMLENYFAARPAAQFAPPSARLMPQIVPKAEMQAFTLPRAYKNAIQRTEFATQAEMIAALKAQQIDLAFGDGFSFALLLNAQNTDSRSGAGAAAAQDSRLAFIGKAYPGIGALGQGMRIAVAQKDMRLAAALNYALQQLERKGRLAELYLRYFPVDFY